jgi:VWFA-related protein
LGIVAQDPVIRVSVDLVQVDAMVTDSQGRRVADLKAEDFEILEDGKPQKITHFAFVQGTEPKGASSGALVMTARPLRPEDVHRTIVLVADDLSFSPAEFQRVRGALKDFVDRQMQPGDMVSIMTTSGGMGVREQLTNDKRQLYAAIARIVYSPGRNQFGQFILGEEDGKPRYHWEKDDRAYAAAQAPYFAAGSTSALGYAIHALRDMPGRKAVALFSAGFAGAPAPIVEMAHRSSVVIYTFDMRGIIATWNSQLPPGFWASQGSMDVLAKSTGGIFYHETNAFGASLASALDDMSSYYLIGYQPHREDFNEVNGRAQFHKIQVRVLRPGLKVRSRDGFMGVPDSPRVTTSDAGSELRRALDSPFQNSSLPLHVRTFYSSGGRSKKTGHFETTLRTLMLIDARSLSPDDIADGKKRLVLDVLAGIWGDNDKAVATVDKRFTIEKTADDMARSVASGLAIELEVPVTKAGGYQLRSAVRDAASGQTGSATAFVEIPDFNRPSLALSSVLLSDRDTNRAEMLERAGVMGAGSPVTRVFALGAVLDYDCLVFGARADKETAKPKIDIEVRLFRGPERIYTGQRIPLTIPNGMTMPVHAAGTIKLPGTLPPGDYAVELTAYDRGGKAQPQQAAQWVDFTLAGDAGQR